MDKLNDLVEQAFRHAAENGFALDHMTDMEVAQDMQMVDAEIESYDLFAIQKAVTEYRSKHDKDAGVRH